MNVFHFFLDNWLFTLVVLWLLFSFFGRTSREQTPDKERPAHTHTERRTGRQKERPSWADEARTVAEQLERRIEELEEAWQSPIDREPDEVTPSPGKTEASQSMPPRSPDSEKPYARPDGKPSDRPVKQPYAPPAVQSHARPAVKPYRVRDESRAYAFDQEALRQAVIWAEVLGKPRAKRPYRPPYRQ